MEAMEVVMEVMVMEVMVMERGMLNLVMEVMEVMVEDLMEAMEVVMEVMVMEVMVTEVMEVMEEDHMEVMVAADLMEDMEDTMDNMDNITFHSSYAPKIVNTSACKFTQLLFLINDKFMKKK